MTSALALVLALPAVAGIKVGSYNLCTGDSRKSFIEKGKRGYIAGAQRYWCNSATAVADMIVSLDCDILGIQEVCDSIWGVKGGNDIKRLVEERDADYRWILYPNSGKGTISYDVAIAYKPSAVDTLATGIFWLGGIPGKPKTRSGEPKWSSKPCVWARMREKASGREFYFLSAHTVVPKTYPNDEYPKNRANILNLQELRRGAEMLVPADVPSILVGDLNVAHNAPDWHWIGDGRWTDTYVRLREEGKLNRDDMLWGTQNMKDESGSSKWYPDHIMLHGFEAADFRIDRGRYPTADGTLHYPSDHYPVVADVVFAAARETGTWERVYSPDGGIAIELMPGDTAVTYRVFCDGRQVAGASAISMTLSDGTVLGAGAPRRILRNENRILFQYGNYALEAAAFDDGVAWRWTAGRRNPYKVMSERAGFSFGAGDRTVFSYTHKNIDPFQDDFQNLYTWQRFPIWSTGKPLLDVALKPDDRQVLPWKGGEPPLVVTPALVESHGVKMAVGEADVTSYPGMLLRPCGSGLEARFAGYPATVQQGGKRNLQWIVTSRENYIAKYDGKARVFPWRVICIARSDRELAGCDLITRLATPPSGDFSWVKPGKVSWEWWSNFHLEDAGFTPGVNTATYKAYIDFASRHGIEYVLMDEGWAVKFADDLLAVVPEINIPEIVRYGERKGVGIILWAGLSAFVKDMDKVCSHYAEMGVKGFKIDFFERNDQQAMEMMYRTAATAARHRLLIDFHGCTPPTGLQKTFPNVVNYEGIFGLEQMRSRSLPFYDMVPFDVTAPFIRFLAGPADYTPGAFLNATRDSFAPSKDAPMSQGTRCHQLAEYVVFDAPLQMLCDSPSRYEADPACAEFLYRVPTAWDETRVLEGKVGEYIVTARRSGDVWYIGAMTDWSARNLTIDLSALGTGLAAIEAWEDGRGAFENAADWQKNNFTASGRFTINLAPGGGWAGIVNFIK